MIDRLAICNLNFHTTVGGTQHTLATILPILAKKYNLHIIDPYKNQRFADMLTSDKTHVSSGFRKSYRYCIDNQNTETKVVKEIYHKPKVKYVRKRALTKVKK